MKFSNVAISPAAPAAMPSQAPQVAPAMNGYPQQQATMPAPQGFQLPPQAPQQFQQAPARVDQLPVQSASQQSPAPQAPQQFQQNPAPVTQLVPPANAAAPQQAVAPAPAAPSQPPAYQQGQGYQQQPQQRQYGYQPQPFNIEPGSKVDDSYLPLEVRKARRMPPMTAQRKPGEPVPLSADLFQNARKAQGQVPAAYQQAPVPAAPGMDVQPAALAVPGMDAPAASVRARPLSPETACTGTRQSLARMAYEMQSCFELCKLISTSPFCPNGIKGNPGGVFLAIKYGESLGLDPLQALQGITVISGKPTLYGDALLALCKPYGDIIETYDKKTHVASCTCKRPGYEPLTRTYSLQEAMNAGLVSFNKEGHAVGRAKGDSWSTTAPWGAYTQRMLQMRARGFALRDAFPDILRGIISAEEAEDYQS